MEWTGSVCDRPSHCEFVQECVTANATKQDGLLHELTGPPAWPGPTGLTKGSEDLRPELAPPHLVSHLVSHYHPHYHHYHYQQQRQGVVIGVNNNNRPINVEAAFTIQYDTNRKSEDLTCT